MGDRHVASRWCTPAAVCHLVLFMGCSGEGIYINASVVTVLAVVVVVDVGVVCG